MWNRISKRPISDEHVMSTFFFEYPESFDCIFLMGDVNLTEFPNASASYLLALRKLRRCPLHLVIEKTKEHSVVSPFMIRAK